VVTTERGREALYVVRASGSVEDLRVAIRTVKGARVVRDLLPGRVVVAVPDSSYAAALAALAEAEQVLPDRLEHHTRTERASE
jgi:ribosome-binding factor A